jgi:hypothetical protein
MQRVVRYNREAERFAQLADGEEGGLRASYHSMEVAYRVLAMSVVTELWWRGQGPTLRNADVEDRGPRPMELT